MLIKFKPLFVQPIAHEVIFKDTFERSLQNSFRFVFMSYMYHKGLYLRDLIVKRKGLVYNTVHNNLYLTSNTTKVINANLAIEMCSVIGTEFPVIYSIAKEFMYNADYNAISFDSEGNPIFFKGFMKRFGY